MQKLKYNDHLWKSARNIANYVQALISRKDDPVPRELQENRGVQELFDRLSDPDYVERTLSELSEAQTQCDAQGLRARLKEAEKSRLNHRRMVRWSVASAAAVVAIAVLWGGVMLYQIPTGEGVEVTLARMEQFQKPTLILPDRQITLNDPDGKLTVSELSTQTSGTESSSRSTVTDQKLVVPLGYTYSIVLEDGSEVTLNAGSELIYPTRFDSDQRVVSLNGEAYFNVAKSTRPFVVNTGHQFVKVYGTQFSVWARESGPMRTVLIKGSVGVGGAKITEQRLKPGQMAVLDSHNNSFRISEVQVDDYTAWREGYFRFINRPLTDLLNDLSIWYGVVFEYDTSAIDAIVVNISIEKQLSIDEIIDFLKDMIHVKFKKEGGNVYRILKY